jgi:hypothetical protein
MAEDKSLLMHIRDYVRHQKTKGAHWEVQHDDKCDVLTLHNPRLTASMHLVMLGTFFEQMVHVDDDDIDLLDIRAMHSAMVQIKMMQP